MNTKTRKRVLALLKKRRDDKRLADEAHKSVLANYGKLYDDFMAEKRMVGDLTRRLARLVDGGVEEDFARSGDVRCHWRVSAVLLKLSRDRQVIWDEVFRKMRASLFKWQEGGA